MNKSNCQLTESSEDVVVVPNDTRINFSKWKKFTVVLHFVSVVGYLITYTIMRLHMNSLGDKVHKVDFIRQTIYFSPWMYTLWGNGSQFICYATYLAMDIIEMKFSDNEKLMRLGNNLLGKADYLLFSIAFPLTMTTCIQFWVFYNLDRNTVLPEHVETSTIRSVNHVIHTLPIPLMLTYLATFDRNPPPMSNTLNILSIVHVVYTLGFYIAKSVTGRLVYPGLEIHPPYIADLGVTMATGLDYVFICFAYWFVSCLRKSPSLKTE